MPALFNCRTHAPRLGLHLKPLRFSTLRISSAGLPSKNEHNAVFRRVLAVGVPFALLFLVGPCMADSVKFAIADGVNLWEQRLWTAMNNAVIYRTHGKWIFGS
jgi:hypothetical protein